MRPYGKKSCSSKCQESRFFRPKPSHPTSLMQSLANGSWPSDCFEVLAVRAFNRPRAREATDETEQTSTCSDSVLLRQLSFGLALAGLHYESQLPSLPSGFGNLSLLVPWAQLSITRHALAVLHKRGLDSRMFRRKQHGIFDASSGWQLRPWPCSALHTWSHVNRQNLLFRIYLTSSGSWCSPR